MLEDFVEGIRDGSHGRSFHDHYVSGLNRDISGLAFLELSQAILGGGLDAVVIGAQ